MSAIAEATPVTRLAYSPAEAAQALGISRAKLYLLLDDGTIPSVKLGRRRLIRVADLEAVLGDGGASHVA
jgi:excisionase family DNA binding protein